MHSRFAELLASLAPALRELGVGWYLFGAQAALLYGVERLTADVDVTVHLGGWTTKELVETLRKSGFQMRVEGDDFIERTRVVPVVHQPTGIALDVVLAGPGIEELFLERAVTRDYGGVQVPVACAEDIIVMKTLAGRPKDIEDIVAILRARRDGLDLDLIRSTLSLLEQALDQSDLMPLFERALQRAAGANR
ncbi:MAG TPA: nucleotidyl transferase AbiEii/AbiGii toxin family protein [Candidatus Nanopelagicales bacterium]|nr:nucleotidyl transferase AbiEii/AbiGii toxin family protein [Candidatus Nanopelagicales bacterium]